ncbi:MAG: Holliday junction resolvase RuvX [Coriobacteriaceae bacterium]|nr:Holliday junction resolvase RuvX [Coriobacteriaceae bacterium]
MVALALDIGERRVGIAASDAAGRIAVPVKVLPAAEVTGLARSFRLIVSDHEPDVLVCGLPRTLTGDEGPQATRIRGVAEKLAAELGLELAYADERLSSAEAKRILRAQGLNERQMRGKIDMVAASLFLQAWLDGHDREEQHG